MGKQAKWVIGIKEDTCDESLLSCYTGEEGCLKYVNVMESIEKMNTLLSSLLCALAFNEHKMI